MKIIVLGDIHGNLPALEVALREARAEGCDLLCHTGDLVGFAPFPRETVALMRAARLPGVRGEIDASIAAEEPAYDGGEPGEAGGFERRAYAWTLARTDRVTRGLLSDLPFEQRFEAGGRRAVVVHANPIDAWTPLREDRDEDFLRTMGDAADADLILFGHTHRPWHRVVDGRHFINAGSVGYPRDGDPRTGYVVIRTNGHVEVQFRRFPYDVARLIRAARERGFPPGAESAFAG
ncbi:MAG: metallophosphoesterase family protein [Candidatus Polarisedimenticolia bacterium]